MTVRSQSDSPEIVTCLAGFRYPEKPRSFVWENENHRISRIISEARTSTGFQFQVSDCDLQLFMLEYDLILHNWEIHKI